MINEAEGSAQAVVAAGKARAQSIELVSKALGEVNGSNAAALAVAEKYVSAFQDLARTNNTLILPSNTGDVSSMVAQVKIVSRFCEKSPLQLKKDEKDLIMGDLKEPNGGPEIDYYLILKIHNFDQKIIKLGQNRQNDQLMSRYR